MEAPSTEGTRLTHPPRRIGLDAALELLICTGVILAYWAGDFNNYFWTVGINHGCTEGTGKEKKVED
jgi:hypothetical protein